jgi:hypothetical protein
MGDTTRATLDDWSDDPVVIEHRRIMATLHEARGALRETLDAFLRVLRESRRLQEAINRERRRR